MKNLRLDMYVNGKEFFLADAPVSKSSFESCLSASDVVTNEIADQIRSQGTALMSKDEMMSERMLDIMWEITGREMSECDQITFCMCIWEGDEHIVSGAAIEDVA